MAATQKLKKTCPRGHVFFKSSDCPVCPLCEKARVSGADFLLKLSAPARRALEHEGITSLEKLASLTERDILKLHGMGKASLPSLRESLAEQGLHFS